MNDDELITTLREQRGTVTMTTPVEQIISRGRAAGQPAVHRQLAPGSGPGRPDRLEAMGPRGASRGPLPGSLSRNARIRVSVSFPQPASPAASREHHSQSDRHSLEIELATP